jgi:ketosteroid isomerase-like protein
MKTKRIRAPISVLTVAIALAAAIKFVPGNAATPSDDVDGAANSFDAALEHADEAAIKKSLTPDFAYVSRTGKVFGKEKLLALFTDPQTHFDPFVDVDRQTRLLTADSAVVFASRTVSAPGIPGLGNGKRRSDTFRYLEIFTRRDGVWRVALYEVGTEQQPSPAAQ